MTKRSAHIPDQPDVTATASVRREYPHQPIATAHAVVFRGEQVLVIRRAHDPSKGRWSVPGGMIELGETVSDVVQREVQEECGIDITITSVLTVLDNIVPNTQGQIRFHYVVIYLLAQYARSAVHPQSDASEAMWATRHDIDTLDMHPLVRNTVQQAFARMAQDHMA